MRCLVAILCLYGFAVAAGGDGVKAYDIIATGNIFSPTRGVRRVEKTAETREPETPAAAAESLTLTGVVVIDGKASALLAGTVDSLTGSRQVGDQHGSLEITKIETTGVTLASEQGELHLSVGATLTRAGNGPWQVAAGAIPALPAPRRADPGVDKGPEPASPPGHSAGTSPSDILKRLRERRQQELSK